MNNYYQKWNRLCIIVFAAFFSLLTAMANAAPTPLAMLETTVNQTIAELNQNRATLKTNPKVVYQIVNRVLLPHVDITAMSRSVLGRDAWLKATPSQKQQFSREFIKLVVRTYATGLASYTNETVKFEPLRNDYSRAAAGTRIQVYSKIIRQDGPPIQLDYRVIYNGTEWKVYDLSVEGVSLLESFRADFSDELAQGNLDQLINNLKQRNARS